MASGFVWFVALLLATALAVPAQTQAQMELSEKGKALMAESKFSEAAAVYRQLLQTAPDSPGVLLNLGMALHLAGHSRQAVAPLEKALKLDATIEPAWLFLGASYLGAGDAARALPSLRKYVKLAPEDPGGHQTLGDALLDIGSYSEAAVEYKKLSEFEPGNPRAWYGLNRCYTALSEAEFKTIEKQAPGSAWWLALVADERVVRRQFRSAFFFYKKAEALQPGLPGLHTSIAQVYRATERPEWADAESKKEAQPRCTDQPLACEFASRKYAELIAQTGTTPEVSYWRSRAFAQLAQDAFGRLEQLPEGPEIHEMRAEVLQRHRQHLEAAREWKMALKYAPEDPHLREELLSSLYQAHDYPAALALADELLREDPALPSLNLTKGYVLLDSGDADKAIPYLKNALRGDPKSLQAHAALGRAYVLSGQFASAIPQLSAARPVDEDGSLRYELAKAYRATGQLELANKTLEEYQEWQKTDREQKQKLEQEMQITAP